MNRLNLPWLRNWEQQDLELESQHESLFLRMLYALVFIALCAVSAVVFVDGLDRSALYEKAKAEGEQRGRVEMLLRVKDAVNQQGNTLEAYYSAASQQGMTGFDGVVLVDSRP